MATGTAQSLIDKISQGHLECCICVERFKEPKMLNCQHSFCLICLQKLKEKRGGLGQKLTCPVCRQTTFLIGKNVADLPTDIKLISLLDEVNLYEKQYFLERKKKTFKCDKHNQDLNIYCDTCKKLECTTCIVLNVEQSHTNHNLFELPEALNLCKQKLEQLVSKVQQKIVNLNVEMDEAAKSYKKFLSKVEETNQKISKKADSEVARIREEETKLKQDVAWFYNDKAEVIKTVHTTNVTSVTKAEHKLDEVEQLMAQASSYEILRLIEKPLHDIKKLTEVQQNKVYDEMLSFTYFREDLH